MSLACLPLQCLLVSVIHLAAGEAGLDLHKGQTAPTAPIPSLQGLGEEHHNQKTKQKPLSLHFCAWDLPGTGPEHFRWEDDSHSLALRQLTNQTPGGIVNIGSRIVSLT